MRRFYAPPSLWGDCIELPETERHHARDVLRLRPGDTTLVVDGCGKEVEGRFASLSAGSARVVPITAPREQARGLTLVLGQGLPKGDKLSEIIERGTELGLSELFPLALYRSVPIPTVSRQSARHQRWQRKALEAMKQCRSAFLPTVHEVSTLETFCRRFEAAGEGHRGIVFYEEAGRDASLGSCLEQWTQAQPNGVWLLIGPEGGLVADEVLRAARAGFDVVSMGSRVLRTETASLAALAILQFRRGDIG